MGKNKKTSKQDNDMSGQHKKRHVSKNELNPENRYDDNKRRNRVQRIRKRNT